MSKLANIPKLDQGTLKQAYAFSIKAKENIVIIGPAGSGKTDMAFQAAKECGKNLVYWNMSVMERPDIQGIPVVSADGLTTSFACQEAFPFQGINLLRQRRQLDKIIASEAVPEEHKEKAKSVLERVQQKEAFILVQDNKDLLEIEEVSGDTEEEQFVLLLDEVDKTPPENLQPLLELLLYHTINGRKVNVQSIILTGNLPDENTYSEPLSHALTNRCMVYELVPSIKIWLDWAKDANLHPIVVAFLSKMEHASEFFHKRPSNNQIYSYAYPTPRSWAKASELLLKYNEISNKEDARKEAFDDKFQNLVVASAVGEEAAEKLNVWLTYYRKYDPWIEAVFNNERNDYPEEIDGLFVCCSAVIHKFTSYARSMPTAEAGQPCPVKEKARHIFRWLDSDRVPADVKVCSVRAAYHNETYLRHNMSQVSEFQKIFFEFLEIQNTVRNESQ